MQLHKGQVIAGGILCAIAATVSVWSGPLASASGSFHTGAPAPAHVHASADRLH